MPVLLLSTATISIIKEFSTLFLVIFLIFYFKFNVPTNEEQKSFPFETKNIKRFIHYSFSAIF